MRVLILILALLPTPTLAGEVLAARTLRAGTVLVPEDLRLAEAGAAGLDAMEAMIGQETRVMVTEGRPIEPAFLRAPRIVERNQIVVLAYDRDALRIEAEGRALSDGALGDTIRVMNNLSRVTVSGRVAADGSVIVH